MNTRMKQKAAMKKVLEHAFWATYPKLDQDGQYSFSEILGDVRNSIRNDQLPAYITLFAEMVDQSGLPLIPVAMSSQEGVYAIDHFDSALGY